jgi:hypothetical protein
VHQIVVLVGRRTKSLKLHIHQIVVWWDQFVALVGRRTKSLKLHIHTHSHNKNMDMHLHCLASTTAQACKERVLWFW